MAKIDNEKMWASMLNYEPTKEEKERLCKALRTGKSFPFGLVMGIVIRGALREQGLMEKDGKIVDYEPQYKVGDWVVNGTRTCCVGEVLGKQIMVIAPSLFGGVKTFCDAADVHPWTLEDAKKGDFLAVDDEMIFISKGADDNVCNYFACYDLKKQQFYDDDGCSSLYKDKMRPATDEEVSLLKEQIDIHGYHWNLDKMELEEKRKENIRAAFPQSDYAQLQQDMNELSDRVKTLEERLFHIEIKDMPLGGNSCV